jgi:O-antigen/teichoic acid export membrane protein
MTYYVFFSLYLSLGLSVLAEDVIRLLGTPAYYEAYRVVPLLALSYVFYGMYFVASGGVQLAKRTHYLAYVAGGAALLQIALNFWLIPRFDMLGAAWAAALSYLVMPFWIGWISQQFHPVTYDLARIGKLFVVAATLYGLSRVYRVANPFLSVVVRSLFALSYPLVSYGIGFFTEEEKNASKQLLGRFWRMLRGWQKP